MKRLVAPLACGVVAASAAPAAADSVVTRMPGKYFDPSSVSLVTGDTAVWRNLDFTQHTVASSDGLFQSDRLSRLGAFSYRFDTAGDYRVYCSLHTFMVQSVGVHAVVLTGPDAAVFTGGSVPLSGRTAAGAAEVAVEREATPGTWVPVTSVTPAADGTFSLRVSPSETTSYRAVVATGASPVATVRVTSELAVGARVDRGRTRTRVDVRVRPAPAAVAVLETYNRERFAWRRAGRARLGRDGRVRFQVRADLRRVARIRILAESGAEIGRSVPVKLHPKARGPARVIRPDTPHGAGGESPAPDSGGEHTGH